VEPIAYLVIVGIVALSCWATLRIVHSRLYSRRQLIGQLLVVWFLPVLGSLLVLIVLQSQQPQASRSRSDTDHDLWQNAQDKTHGVE
jgi:TRAP-type C4-dicarboxylate transport system permease small subunit